MLARMAFVTPGTSAWSEGGARLSGRTTPPCPYPVKNIEQMSHWGTSMVRRLRASDPRPYCRYWRFP
jgi:hypothetical protein